MIKILNLLLALFFYSTSHVHAGVFDSFKKPSELILNQKDCWLFSEYRSGQMIEGKFVYRNQLILGEFIKLGKDKVSFKNLSYLEPGETRPDIALFITKDGKQINASMNNGRIILSCNL